MKLVNHILIDDEIKMCLEKNKISPRETYNDVLRRMLKDKLIKMKGGEKR